MSAQGDSIIGDLAKWIPGYGGYREQETRREDDRRTREFLGRRLRDCKSSLEKFASQAIEAGDFDTITAIERIRTRVDHAQARLAAAVEGYSGWFSARQVDAELLRRVAELDANLVSLVDRLDTGVKSAVTGDSRWNASELTELVELLHVRIDRRSELLKGEN